VDMLSDRTAMAPGVMRASAGQENKPPPGRFGRR